MSSQPKTTYTGSHDVAFTLDREQAMHARDWDGWRTATAIYADFLLDRAGPGDDELAANLQKELADFNEEHPPKASHWPDVATSDWFARLTAHQREQLAVATSRPFGVLCGSPGTGKTTVAATLANCIPAAHLAVTAPTGKAAVRMREALAAINPHTTIAPTTIHQLLGIDRAGYDGGGWQFVHTADNPLPYRFVIIDEPSILSLDLAADLFRAIRPGTHVLAVGDPDQLPPVGSGAVLRDWIGSGVVPVGRLTEIHRNGGAIALACRAIREGKQDEAIGYATVHPFGGVHPSVIAQPSPQENWRHIEAASPEQSVEVLKQLLGAMSGGRKLPGLCPTVQLLAPVREKGPLSCAAVNRLCQESLNPNSPEVKAWGTKLRIGDRLICQHNHWATLATNTMRQRYVANGEIGTLTDTDPRFVGQFGSDIIRLARGEDDNFALGYCITGHRSQGSEWPITIVLLDSWAGRNVMGREWIYTVLSRARHLCITIGRLWSVRQAVAEQRLERRRTFLDLRIREGVVGVKTS